MNIKKLSYVILLVNFMVSAQAEPKIQATQSPQYVGQYVTVCGNLAGYKHFSKVHFFNLDRPYPNQSLTVVIFNDTYKKVRRKFGVLENFVGQKLCATGKIAEYKGRLEIKVNKVSRLKIGN